MTSTPPLHPDLVLPSLKAGNRRQAFQIMAEHAARATGLDAVDLLERLNEWERKSAASGIGGGVGVLHLTPAALDAPFLLLARADHAIDYDSLDGQPVDLIVFLLSPLRDGPKHLQRLSRLTRLLRDQSFCRRLRGAHSAEALQAVFLHSSLESLAA